MSRNSLRAKKGKRIVLIGLDGAGKTTILQQLINRGAAPDTLPTIGFTVQELVLDGLPLTVFDVGGQEKIRELWSQYCRAADGLVLVVDAGDPTRFIDVRTELVKLLHGTANLCNAVVLVLANKQDQPQSLAPMDLSARLRLHEIEQRWHIEGTIGLDGTGIDRGFDWLMSHLSHAQGSRIRVGLLARGSSAAADAEQRALQAGKELRALHSLAQELETMRVQNEQLAARLFTVEQHNGELSRENKALRAAAGAEVPHVGSACKSPRTPAILPRAAPVSEVRRRALEARATAEELQKQNHALAGELISKNGAASPPIDVCTPQPKH